MKAMVLDGDYGIDNLKLSERPVPEPGPGEIVLRMKAASLNYRDLATVQATFGPGAALPMVPLSDGCGEVVAVGEGVTRVAYGDRVAPIFFQGWLSGPPRIEGLMTALGSPIDGCAQEYMCLSEQGVVKVPDYLTDEEVASLPCAALTAWRALVVEGNLKAGDTVLLQGTGGVSIFALQFAKAHGAEVIITSSSGEKLERAKELGADHLVNYKETPNWAMEARKITGGLGVDHVVEVGGAETFEQALQAIRIGGNVIGIGVLSGAVKPLSVAAIFGANAHVLGITVGSRDHFEDMCKAMALSKIKPIVDKTFKLEELPEALRHMESGSHFGKIALEIG